MRPTGPQRIVCLTEETTEFLYRLGEAERIIGISAYTVRPPQARAEKEVVSAFVGGSVPRIVALEPDLVIGFSDVQGDFARDLIRAGLDVLITNQRSLAEIKATMRLVASLVGKVAQADRLIGAWDRQLAAVAAAGRDVGSLRVFFQEWDIPVISGILWVSELVSICGAVDVCACKASGKSAQERTWQPAEIAGLGPDVILGSWCGKPMDFGWVKATWADTPAVRSGCVYELDASVILQPGPALFLDGIHRLREVLAQAALRLGLPFSARES